MKILRILLALAILRVSRGFQFTSFQLNRAAFWLLPVSHTRASIHPAEVILIGSIVGLALCVLWFWMAA